MKDAAEIIVIVDRSGSMTGKEKDVIGGFNKFLQEQKELGKPAKMTYVQFDNVYEVIHDGKDIKDVPELNKDTYIPRGCTALLDAIGRAFNTVGERLHKTSEEERSDTVIVVIITDGQENASQEFTAQQVKDMIKHQQDVYSWKVIFMASDLGACDYARNLSIPARGVFNYTGSGIGTQAAYHCVSSNVRRLRTQQEPDDATELGKIGEEYKEK